MQKFSNSQRQSLLHGLHTEKNPFRLAKLMNENEVGRVAVHPAYHRYYKQRYKLPDAAKASMAEYEQQVAHLFQTPEDFKRSLFIFETLYAENEAWDMFLENGSRFDMASRMAYSYGGSLFSAGNGHSYGDGNSLAYEARDERNPVFAAAKRVMESSSAILVFGVYLDCCVEAAVNDLAEMSLLLKLDLPFITVNPAFSLSTVQVGQNGPEPQLVQRWVSSMQKFLTS